MWMTLKALAVAFLVSRPAPAATSAEEATVIRVEEMTLDVPSSWTLKQNAADAGTIILGFGSGSDYLTLFVKREVGIDLRAMLVNGSTVTRELGVERHNGFEWRTLSTSKTFSDHTIFVSGFLTELNGATYYGYARGGDATAVAAAVSAFLDGLR